MRKSSQKGALTARAIAGCRVVLFGMDVDEGARDKLAGFAIHCKDKTSGRAYWLPNLRVYEREAAGDQEAVITDIAAFRAGAAAPAALAAHAQTVLWGDDDTAPALVPSSESEAVEGAAFLTSSNPIQAFHWADYTAKPGHDYTYRVVAMYGAPGALTEGDAVELDVRAESPDEGTHGVWFNRGVMASQRYTQLFGDKTPDEVPDGKAFTWLSNGLLEALLAFLGKAKDASWGLRAAVYEFSYAPVLEAFAAAVGRGADVKIVYDAKAGDGKPKAKNEAAIEAAGLGEVVTPRAQNPSYISHNKFIVLTHEGKPVEVWTGSTNITAGGIFGQSNVGHVCRDPEIAKRYHDYWEQLEKDPAAKDLRKWNDAHTPLDPDDGLHAVFSPRGSLAALERYAALLGAAEESACFTAAFGVNQLLLQEMGEAEKGILRYVLLEKDGGDVSVIEGTEGNQAAAGAALEGSMGRWVGELDPEAHQTLNKHVFYIHDKLMILDGFGDSPRLITGSANFSDASTRNNDENMLVIPGDTRVVDIYLGEFMRLFTHYRFRAWVRSLGNKAPAELAKLSHLDPTDAWSKPAYEAGSREAAERRLFAGTKAG